MAFDLGDNIDIGHSSKVRLGLSVCVKCRCYQVNRRPNELLNKIGQLLRKLWSFLSMLSSCKPWGAPLIGRLHYNIRDTFIRYFVFFIDYLSLCDDICYKMLIFTIYIEHYSFGTICSQFLAFLSEIKKKSNDRIHAACCMQVIYSPRHMQVIYIKCVFINL